MTEPKTFGLSEPFDILTKLERELERCRLATNRDDLVDHALNFALTAWHMCEWVHNALKKMGPQRRAKAVKKLGAPYSSLDDFQKWAMTQCPALKYCRMIASHTKHLGCDAYPDDPEFTTPVSATNTFKPTDPVADQDDLDALLRQPVWVLKIVDSKERMNAFDIFEYQVLPFWTNIVHGRGIKWGPDE